MPSFADWLKASFADYRRRWAVMLAVAGLTGAAALLGGFLPFLPAGLLSLAGAGNPWVVWGAATLVSLTAVLWLSTWAQAAATRVALTDDPAPACLREGWKATGAFGWALTLVLVAVCGGWVLLVLPGLALSVLLLLAPMAVITGEAEGTRALALSWARVKPRFGTVAGRMLAASLITAAPGWIPYVGWLIAMFWAPFGLFALARLEKDLRAAEPAPAVPDWMGGAVAALSLVLALGLAGAGYAAVKGGQAAARAIMGPGGLAERVHPETAQAYIEALGRGDEEGANKAYKDIIQQLRTPPADPAGATPVSVSTTVFVGGAP